MTYTTVRLVVRLRLVLLALLFAACDSRALNMQGYVIQKVFEPAHDTTRWVPVGKAMVRRTEHHPDAYHLLIGVRSGEPIQLDVDRAEYSRTRVGDALPLVVELRGCATVRRPER